MDFTDLNQSMGAFESAVSSTKARVQMPTCGAVLLAVDGSEQDATAIALAAEVAPRLRAKLRVTIGSDDHEIAARAVAELKAQGHVAETVTGEGDTPAARILAAQTKTDAGLVIVPAPYLEAMPALRGESLGTTVDMLLAEVHGALLVVRDPIALTAEHLKRFLLPMTVFTPALASAAGWAFSLAEGAATIDLYAVADQKAVEAAAELVGEVDEEHREARSADALLRAEHRNAGGMISAVQQRASDTGVNVNVDIDAGDPVSLVLERLHREPALAIVGAPLDHKAAEFHRVHDIVLGSKHPVLVARA
ncbi:MAG: universal stress protein [Labilithrix sp.]|nr:universal stress protein [Labilithrix sp.]MCW5831369.1 universal stress protein [Labilithrix sp.]